MRKKIISIILSVLCFASLINLPVSAEETTESYKYRQIIDMGFLSDDEEPDYIVTRGEFAQIMCGIRKLGSGGSGLAFNDVAYGDAYYDSIQLVSSAGIMIGYDDGSFRPAEPIKVSEAVKVLVEAAGYRNIAQVFDTFGNGYKKIADDIDLFRHAGINDYNAAIKRRELGIMLFNLMVAPVSDITATTAEQTGYTKSEESFAQTYHGLKYITGVVTANSYTNFSEQFAVVPENKIAVGNTLLEAKEFKNRFLIGRYVSVFYDEESETIVSITERTEDEEILTLMSYEISELTENSVSYSDLSRSKTVKLRKDTIYVYNDKTVLSYDFTKLRNEKDYCLTFVDNNDDGEYDTVFIENYCTVAAGDITSDFEVKSKLMKLDGGVYSGAGTVNIDEDVPDTVIICDSEYNRYTSRDVKNGDILTVIENEGYRRIMLSRRNISLNIGSVSKDNGHWLVQSEDAAVYGIEELELFFNENNVIGSNAVIYTDIFGNAAYIVLSTVSDEKCGLLINAFLSDENGENEIVFKIFSDSGEEIRLLSAEKIKINDSSVKSESLVQLPEALNGVSDIPVLYKTNEQGQIREMILPQTSLSGNVDGFFMGASLSNVNSSVTPKLYGGTIETGASTIAFILPEGTYNKDTSAVQKGDAIHHDTVTKYTVDGYYKSRNNDTADIVVIKNTNFMGITANSSVGVITKVNGVEIYDDEPCQKIEYLSNGIVNTVYVNEQKYPVSDIASVGAGDTVRIAVDRNKYLRAIEVIYDYDEEKYLYSSNLDPINFSASAGIGWGYVARSSNGRIRVSTDNTPITDSSVYSLMMHVLANYDLMMVESEKEITKCTAADINVGDKVVMVLRSGRGKAMVVYK